MKTSGPYFSILTSKSPNHSTHVCSTRDKNVLLLMCQENQIELNFSELHFLSPFFNCKKGVNPFLSKGFPIDE